MRSYFKRYRRIWKNINTNPTEIQQHNCRLESVTYSEGPQIRTLWSLTTIWFKWKEAEKIIKSFPQLENISVDKKYPKKLEIKFTKYPLSANVINESSSVKKTYIINQIGFVLKEDYENPELPYIRIKSEEPINTKKAIISKEKLKYILDSMTYFQDKFGMRVKEALYKPVAREVHLLTEKDFYIWLDMQTPFEDQLKKLKKTLVKLDIQKEPLYYIDLRISGQNGEKIIYKRR